MKCSTQTAFIKIFGSSCNGLLPWDYNQINGGGEGRGGKCLRGEGRNMKRSSSRPVYIGQIKNENEK